MLLTPAGEKEGEGEEDGAIQSHGEWVEMRELMEVSTTCLKLVDCCDFKKINKRLLI